ncbi:hypothetical protein OG21DRAFT_1516068 [Imleria badia]|nr:hypothetical protein OG21DRAFT_1516068 [Imleria badia]
MPPSYWIFPPGWDESASDILNQQASEESTQKSASALSMPMTEDQPFWPDLGIFWPHSASEILKEQAEEEAQY